MDEKEATIQRLIHLITWSQRADQINRSRWQHLNDRNYRSFVKRIGGHLETPHVFLGLVHYDNDSKTTLEFKTGTGAFSQENTEFQILGEAILSQNPRLPILVSDFPAFWKESLESDYHGSLKFSIVAPIRNKEWIFGVIGAAYDSSFTGIDKANLIEINQQLMTASDDEVDTMQAFAYLTIASERAYRGIENARDFESNHQRRKKRNSFITAIAEACDPITVLTVVCNEAINSPNVEAFYIGLLTPDQTQVVLVAGANANPKAKSLVGTTVPLTEESSLEHVIETGKTEVLNDPRSYPTDQLLQTLFSRENLTCVVIEPFEMEWNEKALGAIYIGFDQKDAYFLSRTKLLRLLKYDIIRPVLHGINKEQIWEVYRVTDNSD